MMKGFLCSCLCMVFMLCHSLANSKGDGGIQWTTGLNWQQVKEKALRENKYIFLDCFATWCGPCKEMDKIVYINDTVGNFLNERFISVKVQMDKTKNDNEHIKNWYADAEDINKRYRVLGFPTYIFLAPDGKIVHQEIGFKSVSQFVKVAELAVQPGKVYVDKYEEFNKLEAEYISGVKRYASMPYMIEMAQELGNEQLVKGLKREYLTYLAKLDESQLFTKKNLLFLGNKIAIKSDSPFFTYFHKNGKTVDKVVGSKGYAETVVSKTIYHEVTKPFLRLKPKDNMMGGKLDSAEANWKGVYDEIIKKYSKLYAERGLLEAQLIWYEQHFNYPSFYRAYLEKLDRYGFDTADAQSNTTYQWVNFHCWRIFLSMDDQLLLERAAKHMRRLIRREHSEINLMQSIDTYANLLYKMGKKARAIRWEFRAIDMAFKLGDSRRLSIYTSTLSKIKTGKQTWSVKKSK